MPPCELPAGGGRPHQIKNRGEVNLDVDGLAFNFIAEDPAGLVQGYKELFADDVIESDINAGDGLWFINDAPKLKASIRLGRCSPGPKADFVITEDLEGIYPTLKSCFGIPHNDRTPPVDGHEADGLDCVCAYRKPVGERLLRAGLSFRS